MKPRKNGKTGRMKKSRKSASSRSKASSKGSKKKTATAIASAPTAETSDVIASGTLTTNSNPSLVFKIDVSKLKQKEAKRTVSEILKAIEDRQAEILERIQAMEDRQTSEVPIGIYQEREWSPFVSTTPGVKVRFAGNFC